MTQEELIKKFEEFDQEMTKIRQEAYSKIQAIEVIKYQVRQAYFEEHAEYEIGEKVLFNENWWNKSSKWILAFVDGYTLSYRKEIQYILKRAKKDGTVSKRFVDQFGTHGTRIKKYTDINR